MSASTTKTLGLVLVVLAILFIGFRLTPLILAPLGVFSGARHSLRAPVALHRSNFWPFGFINFSFFSIFALAGIILWIAVIIWVYRDADRRRMNGVLWALLVFIGNLIGLLIYLIVRSDNPVRPREAGVAPSCPKCGKSVADSHVFCPYCSQRLQPVCPKCGKTLETGWQACPHCGEKLS